MPEVVLFFSKLGFGTGLGAPKFLPYIKFK